MRSRLLISWLPNGGAVDFLPNIPTVGSLDCSKMPGAVFLTCELPLSFYHLDAGVCADKAVGEVPHATLGSRVVDVANMHKTAALLILNSEQYQAAWRSIKGSLGHYSSGRQFFRAEVGTQGQRQLIDRSDRAERPGIFVR